MTGPSGRSGRGGGAPPGGLLPGLDGRAGPARRLASPAASELVRSAIDTALAAPDDVDPSLVASARRRLEPRRALAYAAAALIGLSLVGGAAALVSRILEGRARLEPPPAPAAVERPMEPAADERPAKPAAVERPTKRPTRPAIVERPVERPVEPAAVEQPAPAEPPQASGVEDARPEDLLALANDRRRAREWREADRLYGMVVSRHPSSDAAVVAEIASAELHLRRLGDAAGALAAFRRALAAQPSGPLAEEAGFGIAEAHRALGDRPGELEALRAFLERHPQSPLAPAARRRRDELAP